MISVRLKYKQNAIGFGFRRRFYPLYAILVDYFSNIIRFGHWLLITGHWQTVEKHTGGHVIPNPMDRAKNLWPGKWDFSTPFIASCIKNWTSNTGRKDFPLLRTEKRRNLSPLSACCSIILWESSSGLDLRGRKPAPTEMAEQTFLLFFRSHERFLQRIFWSVSLFHSFCKDQQRLCSFTSFRTGSERTEGLRTPHPVQWS